MRTVPMNLLFEDIDIIETRGDPAEVQIGGISHDSRRVVPGDLFCCVPGLLSDGHAYARQAADRGAPLSSTFRMSRGKAQRLDASF